MNNSLAAHCPAAEVVNRRRLPNGRQGREYPDLIRRPPSQGHER